VNAGVVASAAALVALALYLGAAVRLRRRGDTWSRWRDLAFTAGAAGVALAASAPLPGGEFTGHMAQHLLTGMLAPVPLVVARPVTLALRVLRGRTRRGLVAVARSVPARVLVCPPVAAALDVGGLWALYRSGLFAAVHDRPWAHALVHLHMLVAGVLFSAAVCQLEPLRHRYSVPVRAATLVLAGTAHAVLAKSLWAAPPPGTDFPAADLHTGAAAMYYGGDLAEIGLAVVIAARWYAAGGRSLRRAARRFGTPSESRTLFPGLRARCITRHAYGAREPYPGIEPGSPAWKAGASTASACTASYLRQDSNLEPPGS
jgi:putative membrane protein